jgi:hypothetical protein
MNFICVLILKRLDVRDCVKVFDKFQFPKFPNNICFQLLMILTIIAIFDCRDLNRHKFQPIKDRREGATISVKVDFCCSVEFIVILLNAMRFSSHLNV